MPGMTYNCLFAYQAVPVRLCVLPCQAAMHLLTARGKWHIVLFQPGVSAWGEGQQAACRMAKGGEGSLETAAAQQARGVALQGMGGDRLQEAAVAYAACLAAREHALGPQHPDTAVAMLGMHTSTASPGNLNPESVQGALGSLGLHVWRKLGKVMLRAH